MCSCHQVKDDDRSLSLGTLTVPLMRLLGSPELTLDQWFQLENSASTSRIYITIVLRVCASLWLLSILSNSSPKADLGVRMELNRLIII